MEGILVSILVGLCTGIGALPLLFFKKIPTAVKDGLLGFAGGVMVFVSSFSLIQPALKEGSLFSVVGGIITGTLLLTVIEQLVPHTHAKEYGSRNKKGSKTFRSTLLLGVAVAIHNIPEGFAIGVGYGSGGLTSGISLALAIGIQNIPEGLVVAAPLAEEGFPKGKMILFSFLTGIGDPIAAALGILTSNLIKGILPFILSVAAGAIYYVVSHELIPESHGNGNQLLATYGFILGLILMIIFKGTIGS